MKQFFSEARRASLIAKLVEVGMPEFLAARLTDIDDDISTVDDKLAHVCRLAIKHRRVLDGEETHDAPLDIVEKFLAADCVLIEGFMDEFEERGQGDDRISSIPTTASIMIPYLAENPKGLKRTLN